jgi:hypothetical protein
MEYIIGLPLRNELLHHHSYWLSGQPRDAIPELI